MQETLSEAAYSLDRIGTAFKRLLAAGADSEEVRLRLSEEKKEEIARCRAGMSESEQKDIFFMGLLRDVGKIGAPDTVINKPGRLVDEEFAMVKRHPVIGFEILKDITEMPGIGQGARWHHERCGGGDYPDGISTQFDPALAKIMLAMINADKNYEMHE